MFIFVKERIIYFLFLSSEDKSELGPTKIEV